MLQIQKQREIWKNEKAAPKIVKNPTKTAEIKKGKKFI